MSLTIDTDTLHRWALDNGYVRLADITEFVRHQSSPDPQQVVELCGRGGGNSGDKIIEIAYAAIDTAAELNDSADDLFPLLEPTTKDALDALRELFDSKGEQVSRELLARFGAKKAGDVPAEKRREFIAAAEEMK